MMIVQMDKMSAPSSSSDRAQRLYERNIELENKRRKSTQARLPSDLNAWQQMRENYESIILEDYGFSEQHNVEYALWQLHYRRIEELRAHFNAALAPAGSNTSLGAKVPVRPDRITKIRLQFRTFLSEATGFYHDLILKIRSKYGLPLGFFSEDSDNRIVMEKDGKKSSNMKKGLISCHRCLIYLGDLARYKGVYGDGDAKAREYAAASSYYLQAASLWPSSGNPHHQLAILASYSGDELVAAYRYFRSLAVDNPFTTARDNLIVAFEKNRQNYSQLVGGGKVSGLEEDLHMNGRGREKGEVNAVSKELNVENGAVKEKTSNMDEILKPFCTRFVRLNGILFTRTSLETFAEVLASTSCQFCELLSSGAEEQLNFGVDAADNGLFILRLVCILMFTVHNVKREAEGQTYAEIVQRAVLLQNAFASIFEFMGHILWRCVQLQDPSASYFLPGILVFVEWLASYPDVASGSDMGERQAAVRLKFWNYYISLMNKVLSVCSISFDDNDDETCFSNMTKYEEGVTDNRLALWEDFELRGFVPLLPAQTILDFSRKQPLGNNGSKEKMARVKRILAAGKALASIVKLDQKTISFDSMMKKFVIGAESPFSDDSILTIKSSMPEVNGLLQELQPEKINLGMQPKLLPSMGGDDEDEVIVFKPTVVENRNDLPVASYEGLKLIRNASLADLNFPGGTVPVPLDIIRQQVASDPRSQVSTSVGTMVSQHVQQPIPASKWLGEEVVSLANSLKSVKFMENGHLMGCEMQKGLPMANSSVQQFPIPNSGNLCTESMLYSLINPSKVDAVAISGVAAETASQMPLTFPSGVIKSPVSRPVRHLGPPPGFSSVPAKHLKETVLGPDLSVQNPNPLMDDYSWLDGYQLSSTKGYGFNNSSSVVTYPTSQYMLNSNGLTGNAVSFPFPGKQISPVQPQSDTQISWQNYQALEHWRLQQEQQLPQQLMNGNQQLTSMPEQYQGQSIWSSRYMV